MDPSMAIATQQGQVIARMPKYAQTYLKKMQDADPGNIAFKNEPYVSKIRFEPTIATDGSNNVTFTFKQGSGVDGVLVWRGRHHDRRGLRGDQHGVHDGDDRRHEPRHVDGQGHQRRRHVRHRWDRVSAHAEERSAPHE
jgi:hypothetical protein